VSFWPRLGHFFTTSANWTGADGIVHRVVLQAELSAIVVVIAGALGIGFGFLLGHVGRGGLVAVNAANAARAVPSLALLTLLAIQPSIGLRAGGFLTAGITLVVLAVPPILTNSYVGMREVDADVREAARAMGMNGWQQLWKVEVPLALPLAVAGLRTAAVEVVATATLAAYVTVNDLGVYIFAGLSTQDSVETVAGSLLVALLALLTDLLLVGAYRLVTPEPLRQRRGARGAQVLRRERGAARAVGQPS
jgi:osmoprotectant transport system permease protein